MKNFAAVLVLLGLVAAGLLATPQGRALWQGERSFDTRAQEIAYLIRSNGAETIAQSLGAMRHGPTLDQTVEDYLSQTPSDGDDGLGPARALGVWLEDARNGAETTELVPLEAAGFLGLVDFELGRLIPSNIDTGSEERQRAIEQISLGEITLGQGLARFAIGDITDPVALAATMDPFGQ